MFGISLSELPREYTKKYKGYYRSQDGYQVTPVTENNSFSDFTVLGHDGRLLELSANTSISGKVSVKDRLKYRQAFFLVAQALVDKYPEFIMDDCPKGRGIGIYKKKDIRSSSISQKYICQQRKPRSSGGFYDKLYLKMHTPGGYSRQIITLNFYYVEMHMKDKTQPPHEGLDLNLEIENLDNTERYNQAMRAQKQTKGASYTSGI